ncbi:MAG: permease-like cell division protein FtsX [Candidatus Nanopelagicales bacterium]|jgi:cell division transport system permease protein|nr:permease-like cell division protein FtsX [Candidatus Nanopelagicales bacterium]
MRVRFVLGEVLTGIRRNLTMTVAVVITVAVSLALFGAGLMVRSQVDLMKDYWYDKVQVSVFMCGTTSTVLSCAQGPVTQAQREEIRADLESLQPLVEEVYYESSAEAYQRFAEDMKDAPILESITPEDLPESFRVKLSDPTKYDVVASAFIGRPGVDRVADQRAVLDTLFAILNGFQTGALVIASLMLLATVLLVANTIRVAAFSRRRETGIMRLVGASNFYIQLPFLLEAALAAMIGAFVAIGLLALLKAILVDGVLTPSFQFTSFVGWDVVAQVSVIVFVTGVALASVAALVTLRRYLRV